MNASNAEIRSEIETKIHSSEKLVRELEAKILALTHELDKESHRREVIREFFRLEYGNIPNDDGVPEVNGSLFTIPKRFENLTIRESCQQVLKGKGGMHVSDIASEIEKGGRKASKNSVTSILIRGEEFGRVEGKTNTFYLIEDDPNGSS